MARGKGQLLEGPGDGASKNNSLSAPTFSGFIIIGETVTVQKLLQLCLGLPG